MAFQEPFSDTKDIFEEIINASDLSRLIDIRILTDNNLKVIAKAVKANEYLRHLASVDVIIVVNENVFEELPKHQKIMVADEILAGVGYNHNTEKPIISKGDMQTHTLFLKKYGFDEYEVLRESVITAFEVVKQREEEGGVPEEVSEVATA